VLVRDAVDHRPEILQLVDVRCVHQHRFGERARLLALRLVAHVEDVHQLGMLGKELGIEQSRDCFAVFGEHGSGGLDRCKGLRGQHFLSCWSNLKHACAMHVKSGMLGESSCAGQVE